MYKLENTIADEIRINDPSFNPQRWFEEELYELALRFAGLDDIPVLAIRTLAILSVKGPLDAIALAIEIELDAADIQEHLDSLEGYNFVAFSNGRYEATCKGKDAFRAFGAKWIIRQRFEILRRFEHLDRIYKALPELMNASN